MKRRAKPKKKAYKTVYAAYRYGSKEDQERADKRAVKKSQQINKVFDDLQQAIRENDLGHLKSLLKQWGVNTYSTYGSFPLNAAVLVGNTAATQLILNAGADINQKNFEGDTALSFAAYKGNAKMVRIFLEAGADPTIVNQFGDTALSRAQKIGHANVVALLTEQ